MLVSEVKMRVINTLNSLVDVYFNGSGITERFLNSTLKIIVKQNINKLDEVITYFADKDGEIDLEMLAYNYSEMIPEDGIMFDIKDYIESDFVKNMVPDKALLIKREDIMSVLN
jgi:hypothetical protein